MSPAMRRRSPARGRSHSLSDSPGRNLPSPPRRSSHHRRSPDKHRSSDRTRSPVGTTTSLSTRSLRKEKLPIHARPPERQHSRSPRKDKVPDHSRTHLHRRSRSPVKSKVQDISNSPVRACSRSPVRNDTSRSPSPRSKRLKLAHSNKEADKLMDKNNGRTNSRVHDKGARKEATLDKEISNEKRLLPEKSDDRSSRSVRNNHSKSPHERNRRRNHSDRSPLRSSRTWPQDEVTSSSGGGRLGNAEDDDSVAKMKATEEALEAKQKEKPSFELSGKLAEETNRVRGVTLLFTEPEEARKPDKRWRLYVFKAGEVLNEPLYIHRQSCYLFGRERRVADIPTDHPSCSKQHAVIQYRLIEKEQPDGMMKKQVRPYLMDLGSTNGTFINDNRIEPQRYYELFEKDTIKFGNSSREYVILHENSAQ